jgi:hypothetical protein
MLRWLFSTHPLFTKKKKKGGWEIAMRYSIDTIEWLLPRIGGGVEI